jgi:SAM-dependent methyltransferase
LEGNSLSLLDVGGGSGDLAAAVANCDARISDVHVVDMDRNAQTVAESRGFSFACTTFEQFETDKKYDIILMFNFLEHVRDPWRCLVNARELLSDGGVLFIQTPNFRSLDARLAQPRYWGGLHAPRHFVLFSKSSARRAAIEAGFVVERQWFTQAGPFWAFSILGSAGRHPSSRRLADDVLYLPIMAAFVAFDFLRSRLVPTSQMRMLLRRH